jgi:hypothetical protein
VLDSTSDNGTTTYEVLPPESLTEDGAVKPFMPTVLMGRVGEYLNDYPGSSATQIADGVKGMKKKVREALTAMVQDGSVRVEPRSGRGGGYVHFNAEPVDLPNGPGIFAQDNSDEAVTRSSN